MKDILHLWLQSASMSLKPPLKPMVEAAFITADRDEALVELGRASA
jgi:hypothetical protein